MAVFKFWCTVGAATASAKHALAKGLFNIGWKENVARLPGRFMCQNSLLCFWSWSHSVNGSSYVLRNWLIASSLICLNTTCAWIWFSSCVDQASNWIYYQISSPVTCSIGVTKHTWDWVSEGAGKKKGWDGEKGSWRGAVLWKRESLDESLTPFRMSQRTLEQFKEVGGRGSSDLHLKALCRKSSFFLLFSSSGSSSKMPNLACGRMGRRARGRGSEGRTPILL